MPLQVITPGEARTNRWFPAVLGHRPGPGKHPAFPVGQVWQHAFVDLYEALYTTRAMRRVKPDPVPVDVQALILDAAIRAPSGGNAQNWRFLLVDDPAIKAPLRPLYRESLAELWLTAYKDRRAAAEATPGSNSSVQFFRMVRSAQYLADHFEDVPLFHVRLRSQRPIRWVDFPGGVEFHVRGAWTGRRLGHDNGAGPVPCP